VSVDKIPVSKLPPGRYAIYNDSIQESSGPDYNNPMSLGMAYNTFTLALDMSRNWAWMRTGARNGSISSRT